MGDGTSTGGTYEGSFEQDSLEDVLSPEEKTQAEQNASEKMRRLLHQSLITLVFAAQAFLGVSKYADSQEFIGNWTDFQNRLELISSDPRLDNQDPNSRYYEDIHSLRNVTYEAEELIQDIKDVRLQDLTYSEYRGIQDNLMALGLVFGYGYDLNADGIFDGNIEQLSQGIDMLISEMKEIQNQKEDSANSDLAKSIAITLGTLIGLLGTYKLTNYVIDGDKTLSGKKTVENRKQRRAKEAKERKEEKREKRKNSEKRKNDDVIHVAGNGTVLSDEELLQLIQEQNQKEA